MHTLHSQGSGCGEMPSGVKKVKQEREREGKQTKSSIKRKIKAE